MTFHRVIAGLKSNGCTEDFTKLPGNEEEMLREEPDSATSGHRLFMTSQYISMELAAPVVC